MAIRRQVPSRPRRQRRQKRNDAGFPSRSDMYAAEKLARKVDPVLVELMEAKGVNATTDRES